MAFNFIDEQLQTIKSQQLYRSRTPVIKGTGRIIIVDNTEYVNFSSNDYLGLANHCEIKQAYIQGLEMYGNSSCSSSLITGYSKAHQQLEELLADWLNVERCLLFSSGFAANTGVLKALGHNSSVGYYLDKLSHASLIDGAYDSNATVKRFKHNDMQHLQQLLTASKCQDKLIISEGVYSMDGDCAPLQSLQTLAEQHQSWMLVDDAHGIGVLGDTGSGSLSAQGITTNSNLIQMATFGKAIATSGACIAGSSELVEFLINRCRDYIYSTAMSPANAMATIKSIELCKAEGWRREKIQHLSTLFLAQLEHSIETTNTESSIIGVIIGSEADALFCAKKLREQGFWLTAIRPPTVESGRSRLRVTISVEHNDFDINRLANSINEVVVSCMQNH